MDRKEIYLDLEKVDYKKYADMLGEYLLDKEGNYAEYVAEKIWNDDKLSNQDVLIMLVTLGYIACASQAGLE